MCPIRVALIGTNNLFRQGLRLLLNPKQFSIMEEDCDIVSLDFKSKADSFPDLVVMDLNCCRDSQFENLHQLHALYENLRIVVLANELCLADMARSLKAGADAYLVSDMSGEAFSLSLMLVMQGEKVLPSTLVNIFANRSNDVDPDAIVRSPNSLTAREREILRCLLTGDSNKHIARALDISEGTVKVHMKSLMKKISVHNRTQAAMWALNHGIGDGIEAHIAP